MGFDALQNTLLLGCLVAMGAVAVLFFTGHWGIGAIAIPVVFGLFIYLHDKYKSRLTELSAKEINFRSPSRN